MEEIKVGDFIRTKEGYVGKILRLGGDYLDEFSCDCIFGSGDCKYAIAFHGIAKHSQNIIDLIEEGDYINGCQVTQVTATQLIVRDENGLSMWKKKDVEKHIKHIVTNEQFNSIKYVIGE